MLSGFWVQDLWSHIGLYRLYPGDLRGTPLSDTQAHKQVKALRNNTQLHAFLGPSC